MVTTAGRFLRILPGALLGFALLLFPPGALAQDDDEDRTERIHYAFATYIGSGIYSVEGRTVQVYSFPVTFTLLSEEKRGWGLRLRVPMTVGFYDLKAEDALLTGLPERFATFSVVPSFRAPVTLSGHWTLTPFVDFGAARDLDREKTTWVFGGGARADAVYPVGDYELRPGILALYAHAESKDLELGNDLSKIEAGLDVRVPLGFSIRGDDANLGFFAKNYTYLRELEFLRPDGGKFHLTAQWELGVTFGTRNQFKILGIPVPRFGVSYRFGGGVAALRIVFGNPV